LLEPVFESISEYEPHLCYYAETLYKIADYEKAAKIAINLDESARSFEEWMNSIPISPMQIAAKSYRAIIRI